MSELPHLPQVRLEGLGYPGVSDPKITLETKVSTVETLKYESAVQHFLSKADNALKLPEKYNGLGYQNLISMVFDLIRKMLRPLNTKQLQINGSLKMSSVLFNHELISAMRIGEKAS